MLLLPKNWDDFQHYKDRCPPWIKLHRDLLTDREFMRLPIASKALAPLLWLLASESKDATFDGSLDELMFRLHITEKEYNEGLKPLLDKGFFKIASGVLADSLQVATPEREKEREKERETKKEKKETVVSLPDGFSVETWLAFVDMRKKLKKPMTDHAMKLMIGKLQKMKDAGQDVQSVLEQSITKSWSDVYDIKEQQVYNRSVDIAHQTTPTPKNHDAALRKIEEDSKKAVKPNAEVQARIAALLGDKNDKSRSTQNP